MILRHPRARADITEHNEQSETDSQSQVSEEANTPPQVGLQKRKARVCVDKDGQWPSSELFYSRIDAAFIQGPVSCFHLASYVTIIV
jgi:hypothetical protein